MLTVHFSLLHPHRFCPGSERSAPQSRTNAEACQHQAGGSGVGGDHALSVAFWGHTDQTAALKCVENRENERRCLCKDCRLRVR